MGLTETWLHNQHLEAEIEIPNYSIFRSDRDVKINKRRGRHSGGVAIYIRDDLASTCESILSHSAGGVEIEAIHSNKEKLVIATLYRQPDDSIHGRPSGNNEFRAALRALSTAVHKLDYTPDIIIGGDFNLPHTSWPDCSPTHGCPKEERNMIETLQNFSNDLLLNQLVTESTHRLGNTLDLVLTNNDALIHSLEIQPTIQSISDHHIVKLFTQYKAAQLPSQDDNNPRLSEFDNLNYHSKDVNWEEITNLLGGVNWLTAMENSSVDQMLETIYTKSLEVSKDHVPMRKDQTQKKISKQKRLSMNLARRRRRINKRYQRVTSPATKDKLYKELIQIEVKLQKMYKESDEYKEKKACEAIKENFKFFFSYANKKRKIKSNVGPLKDGLTTNMVTDSEQMAEILADQYSSVFSTPQNDPPTIEFPSNTTDTLSEIEITPEDIIEAIDELRPTAASGPDGFPAILLKQCKKQLAIPLALLWNKSMSTSHIPSSLKFNLITPNHKGGNKADPANYRPIALTSHLIKIYEKVLRNKIAAFLEENNQLNKN